MTFGLYARFPYSVLVPILGSFMHIHFYLPSLIPTRNAIDHDIHNAHAHRIQH